MESVTISLKHYHDIQDMFKKSGTLTIDSNGTIKFFNMDYENVGSKELDIIYKYKQDELNKQWFVNCDNISKKRIELDNRESYISIMEKEIERERLELKDDKQEEPIPLALLYFFILGMIAGSIVTCIII